MIGGGHDLSELDSYDPEAYLQDDNPNRLMGCHKGAFIGLNVQNAQPGRHYYWGKDDPQSILKARVQGRHVVSADDPERAGYNSIEGFDHVDNDSASSGYPGLVLMYRTDEDERRVIEEQAAFRDNVLRGGANEQGFLNGASADEINAGGQRFKRPDHRSFVTDGPSESGTVLESWTPDQGISSK